MVSYCASLTKFIFGDVMLECEIGHCESIYITHIRKCYKSEPLLFSHQ